MADKITTQSIVSPRTRSTLVFVAISLLLIMAVLGGAYAAKWRSHQLANQPTPVANQPAPPQQQPMPSPPSPAPQSAPSPSEQPPSPPPQTVPATGPNDGAIALSTLSLTTLVLVSSLYIRSRRLLTSV